jgi:hypothetical protein
MAEVCRVPTDLATWQGYLEGMRLRLEQAQHAAECLEISDAAEGIRALLKQAGACLGDQNRVAAVKVTAEYKAGALLKRQPPKPNGRPPKKLGHRDPVFKAPPREEVIRNAEKRAVAVADSAPSEAEFRAELRALLADPRKVITSNYFIQKGRQREREKAREVLAESCPELPDAVRLGDFRTVFSDLAPESVALVFTDPPYDRKSLGNYDALAELAGRVLVPGGSLVAYCGNYALPEVCGRLTRGRLRYNWTVCVKHECSPARNLGTWTYAHWKPLVWFTKGARRDHGMVADFIQSSRPDKKAHDWEQSAVEAAYLIAHLTHPGELVLDPMCGSGTTLLSALALGRRAVGAESDDERARVAGARVIAAKQKVAEQAS